MALNINGTTGISGVDGSASAPALQGSDTNTGLSFGTDIVNINTGGSTKASISSVGKLTLTSTETSNSNPVVLNASGQAYYQVITPNNTIGGIKFGDVDDDDVGAIKYGHGDNSMRFDVNASERMRINSSGKTAIGTNSPDSSYRTTIQEDTSGHGVLLLNRTANVDSTYRDFVLFKRSSTTVGSIKTNNSGTQYNTSSDHRLKENVVTMSNATDRLKQLQPKRFNFILNPDTTVDGFLAHEVQSVVPEAISGTKDEVDSENNPVYQGIDQSKLVPLLTAALQEAVAKIEVLETKVAALESA